VDEVAGDDEEDDDVDDVTTEMGDDLEDAIIFPFMACFEDESEEEDDAVRGANAGASLTCMADEGSCASRTTSRT
jgi:hypothetical protein